MNAAASWKAAPKKAQPIVNNILEGNGLGFPIIGAETYALGPDVVGAVIMALDDVIYYQTTKLASINGLLKAEREMRLRLEGELADIKARINYLSTGVWPCV